LHDAIQRIRKPLEYSARHNFAHIERLRELEKTVASWVEQLGSSAALLADQQERLLQFRQLFQNYDLKNRAEKIQIIQQAFQVLKQLEKPEAVPPIPAPETTSADSDRQGRSEASGRSPSRQAPTEHEPPAQQLPQRHYDLSEQIQYARGVGPKRARLLNKLGIHCIEEALFFFPRRYEDRRRIQKIAQLHPGDTLRTVFGTVKTCGVTVTSKRRSKIFELMIGDETGLFTAKWFNQAYLKKIFTTGKQVVLSGKISMKRYGGLEMVQPEYEILDKGEREGELLHTGRIVPIYSLTDGLYQKDMRKIMKIFVEQYGPSLEESLPGSILRKHQLLPLSEALRRIHFPDKSDNIDLLNAEKSPPHRRMIFDEFFLLELGMGLKRHHVQAYEKGISFRFDGILEKYLRESLPFSLTSAQDRVTSEIQKNMRSLRVMNRLLQGDVGSGKTLVAFTALLSAVESGYQGTIMVPTEILAEQHFRKISDDLQRLNEFIAKKGDKGLERLREAQQPDLYSSARSDSISASLLTGGMKKREREEQLRGIERGEIDIVVGTHALL
ncbi:MAG: DEAD/DEAH box helicase, partial [bacterium]|nr:DEAD/DEAH box helicase [bacterium]